MSTAVYESPQEARLVRAFLFLAVLSGHAAKITAIIAELGNCTDVPTHLHSTGPVICIGFDQRDSWA